MNKNILFLAIAAVVAFVAFKVVKGDAQTTTTIEASQSTSMPTASCCNEQGCSIPGVEQTDVKVTEKTESKNEQPQMSQEEFDALIAQLVKVAEEEKKAADLAQQASTKTTQTIEKQTTTEEKTSESAQPEKTEAAA